MALIYMKMWALRPLFEVLHFLNLHGSLLLILIFTNHVLSKHIYLKVACSWWRTIDSSLDSCLSRILLVCLTCLNLHLHERVKRSLSTGAVYEYFWRKKIREARVVIDALLNQLIWMDCYVVKMPLYHKESELNR